MPVTLQKIARQAGVSISTVSRALNQNDTHIHQKTRQRILALAEQMGYVPNLAARSLRGDQTRTIGLVLDSITSEFSPKIVQGILDSLKLEGYSSFIIPSSPITSEEQDAIQFIANYSVDGLIFVDSRFYENRPEIPLKKPSVFVNRHTSFPGQTWVGPDDRYGARLAVNHLVNIGHVRIAHIMGDKSYLATQERLLGYQDVLKARGIALESHLIASGDWSIASGYFATQILIKQKPRITAIFAANDEIAIGAIYAIQDAGLRVPEDIALVGYDDRPVAVMLRPTLTTVCLPTYAMGRTAAGLLLDQLKHPDVSVEHKQIRGELFVRQSCGAKEGQHVSVLKQEGVKREQPLPEQASSLNLQAEITRMRPLPWYKVRLEGGFWHKRQEMNRLVTIPGILNQLRHSGYLQTLKNEHLSAGFRPSFIAVEGPIAKWIEAASYSLAIHHDLLLETQVDELVDLLAATQQPDGYLNTYITLFEPKKRWINLRGLHELFCAGHLLEAAVANYQATQKRTLINVASRYADLICAVFGPALNQKPGYCGHPEIELALVRLYRVTGEQRYLEMACYFVNERGRKPYFFDLEAIERGEEPASDPLTTYSIYQAHKPLREQKDAVGHAVRATYIYSAMSDLAAENQDHSLLRTCETLFESVVYRRMYLTGGIGSNRKQEAFTVDYDLPNESAYAETCAAIGLFFWMHRMLHADCEARYADVMERCLYNGILSGVSLGGDLFFYDNPLAVHRQYESTRSSPLHRQSWFKVPCCPPNLARLIASLGGYIYSEDASGVSVHLYIDSRTEIQVKNQKVVLTQTTEYPWQGKVHLVIQPEQPQDFRIKLRLPGWCQHFTLTVNGQAVEAINEKGYLVVTRQWKAEDEILLDLAMPVQRVYPHPSVAANQGRVALQRGPLVYCLEGVDHAVPLETIFLPRNSEIKVCQEELLGGVVTLQSEAFYVEKSEYHQDAPYSFSPALLKPVAVKAIPYFAWDNRASGDMDVWIHELQ